ncbi:MAG: GIY-YIG nuclease family protein [bacterium]|nr:GIY-YIG nuclease family protein [bacterium]MDA1292654.1 GIY-YIG nuclease family protein [bacterium]
MFYVYILKLKNGQYYIGFTRDLKKRLIRHKNHSTPPHTPSHTASGIINL